MRLGRRSASALAALVLASSGEGRAGTIRHDTDASLHLALAADPAHAAVGRLQAPEILCSGTLVHPRWVLTAAHCVDNVSSLVFSVGGELRSAQAWMAHPDWDGNFASGTDLGLVELESAVVVVAPATLFEDSGAELLELATWVGFGRSGTGLSGATDPPGTKRAGTNTIDVSGQAPSPLTLGSFAGETLVLPILDLLEFSPGILFADFDQPGSPAASRFGSPIPATLELLIAPGDSGGGVFLGGLLAGVHSFVVATDGSADSSYGDAMGAIAVAPYAEWIHTEVPEASPRWGALLGAAVLAGRRRRGNASSTRRRRGSDTP